MNRPHASPPSLPIGTPIFRLPGVTLMNSVWLNLKRRLASTVGAVALSHLPSVKRRAETDGADIALRGGTAF